MPRESITQNPALDHAPVYAEMSAWYDWIMAHVDYSGWSEFIVERCREHQVPMQKVLELGAGTGRMSDELFPYAGEWYIASELQEKMLHYSATAGQNPPYERLAADIRHIPLADEQCDSIFMVYDSINYLLAREDVLRALAQVKRVLQTGGFFWFDITTEFNSLEWFADDRDGGEWEAGVWNRHSWYDEIHRLQHNDFDFFVQQADGLYRRSREEHVQKIWTWEEWVQMIQESGFVMVDAYSDFSREAPHEESERIHILLQKS
jgi:ubiquinone/menaquinone biosynthesis C-methylase UbiE